MTVGELRANLASLHSDLIVNIALNGSFVPVIGVHSAGPGTNFIVIRGKGKIQRSKRYSLDEEGVLGHLVSAGFDDNQIGEVLGRPAPSIARKRKALKKT